jgi:hypothetical protein
MIDLERYRGIGQFGRAYRIMLENDAHAPGSVDRVLASRIGRDGSSRSKAEGRQRRKRRND